MENQARPYEVADPDAFEELQLSEAMRQSTLEAEVPPARFKAHPGDLFTIYSESRVGVEVRPTGARDACIAGQLALIQQGDTVFLNWVPYMHAHLADAGHRGGELNSYTVNFPFDELHCFTRKGVRVIVVLKSHITLPPFVFESYTVACEFIGFMKLNLGLVQSPGDEHTFLTGAAGEAEQAVRVMRETGQSITKGLDVHGGHLVSDIAFKALETSARFTRVLRGMFDSSAEAATSGPALALQLTKLPADLAEQDTAARRSAEAACSAAEGSLQVRSTTDLGDLGAFSMLDSMSAAPTRQTCQRKSPVSMEQWATFFDAEGKVNNEAGLRAAVFAGGLCPQVRQVAWPFLLGYTYPFLRLPADASTARAERYHAMRQQWASMTDGQLRRFTGLREMLHTIEKDVPRTDRDLSFYEGDENLNLERLQRILNTYGMYNFDLGYVQGMSDICSVLLHVVHDEVDTFWCFVGVMETMAKNFAMDQSGMRGHLEELATLIRFIDPELMEFFDHQNADNLYFVFRWLLVFFKREFSFDDIMMLWEVLWTNHLSPKFYLFVCCAILDMHRAQMMAEVQGLDGLIGFINGLALKLPVGVVLETAEAIYLQFAKNPAIPDALLGLLGVPSPRDGSTSKSGEHDDQSSERSWIEVMQHVMATEVAGSIPP